MGIFNVQLFNQNLLGGANENFPLFKSPKRQISYVTGPLWTPPEEMEILKKGLGPKKYATLQQNDKYHLGCIPVSKEFFEKAMNDKRYWILC
ncbi:unknown [Clostridium sp. CAG:813]|nr:unknown [Clostridium sp. CAG:813]